jgi:uncharacterized protein (TIGR02452 family)
VPTAPTNGDVVFGDQVARVVAGTRLYRPEDALLPPPYPMSFRLPPPPNRAAVARSQPRHLPELPAILARRAGRVLAVAAAHGHRRLVLGAWGCGVFGNEPATVAAALASALRAGPWFDLVVFAVLDRRPGAPTAAAFADALLHESA